MKRPAEPHVHLPFHLKEVCQILAMGLLRLRSRSEMLASTEMPRHGESSLHFLPDQSRHANPTNRRDA